MSSSTAGRPGASRSASRPGARRGAAGAADGLCGAEGLWPGGLSFRSPSSSDKRLSTSAILPRHHQRASLAFAQNKIPVRRQGRLAHNGDKGRFNCLCSRFLFHFFPAFQDTGARDACCYELARGADLGVGVGGEGVPRSPDARAGATRSLSRSCLQRSRRRSVCQGSAIWDALESPGSIGGSVRDTGAVITAATDDVGAGRRKRRKDAASSATQDTDISIIITQVAG